MQLLALTLSSDNVASLIGSAQAAGSGLASLYVSAFVIYTAILSVALTVCIRRQRNIDVVFWAMYAVGLTSCILFIWDTFMMDAIRLAHVSDVLALNAMLGKPLVGEPFIEARCVALSAFWWTVTVTLGWIAFGIVAARSSSQQKTIGAGKRNGFKGNTNTAHTAIRSAA